MYISGFRGLTTYATATGCRVGHGGGLSVRAQGANQGGRGAGRGCDSGRQGRSAADAPCAAIKS